MVYEGPEICVVKVWTDHRSKLGLDEVHVGSIPCGVPYLWGFRSVSVLYESHVRSTKFRAFIHHCTLSAAAAPPGLGKRRKGAVINLIL